MSLIAVRVFYRKCPRIIQNGAVFQETLSGAESTSLVAARGSCIANAEEVDVPIKLYCNGDGEWLVPIGRCMCKAGFEAVENGTVCRGKGHSRAGAPEVHGVDMGCRIEPGSWEVRLVGAEAWS